MDGFFVVVVFVTFIIWMDGKMDGLMDGRMDGGWKNG